MSSYENLYLYAGTGPQTEKNRGELDRNPLINNKLERETRFELATCTLARYLVRLKSAVPPHHALTIPTAHYLMVLGGPFSLQ